MRKSLLVPLTAFAILLTAGCAKDFDDGGLQDRLDEIEAQAEENANTLKILEKRLQEALVKNLSVDVQETEEGYIIRFSDGTSITVNNGKEGEKGEAGGKGERGDKGLTGDPGKAGSDVTVTVTTSSDGSAYIISWGTKQFRIPKNHTFSLVLEHGEVTLSPGQTTEIGYSVVDADASVHVYIADAAGYTADVDETRAKVLITAPATLPEEGYVVVSAVKNSTGEQAIQYIGFVTGTLEVAADTQLVEAAGGTVTLTVTADSDYTVSIPETCTWIHRVDSRAVTTSSVYLRVDKNTAYEPRSAVVSIQSPAGTRTVGISQKAAKAVDPSALNLSPEDADEKIAAIQAMTAAELSGKTIHFAEGTYTLSAPLSLSFTESEPVPLTIEGEEGAILDGQGKSAQLLRLSGLQARITGLTFKDSGASALYIDKGDITVNACRFTGNSAGNSCGGAIFMSKSLSTLKVSGSTFSGNKARYGGDIYMVNGNLTVENSTFTGSEGFYTGAAINVSGYNSGSYYDSEYGHSKVSVKNSTFTGCKAGSAWTDTEDAPTGVLCATTAEMTVDGCVFDSCEGKSGTVVCLSSRTSRWGYLRGNGFLKMNGCTIRKCSVTRLGLIYMNADGYSATQTRSVVFLNNTSFYDNSSSTGDFGTIAHSGGNGGVILLNNCTIYKETVPETSENGFAFNTDGCILLSNSTLVTETTVGLLRNGDGNGSVKFINSIGINTGTKASTAKEFGFTGTRSGSGSNGDDSKNTTTDGHCIIGPSYSSANTFKDPVLNATTASLSGFNWNAATGLIEWNGPAESFSKLSASDFKAQLTGFGPATSVMYSEASAGEAFYNWLNEIGAIGKDARGNSRGSSWWPGAYQK